MPTCAAAPVQASGSPASWPFSLYLFPTLCHPPPRGLASSWEQGPGAWSSHSGERWEAVSPDLSLYFTQNPSFLAVSLHHVARPFWTQVVTTEPGCSGPVGESLVLGTGGEKPGGHRGFWLDRAEGLLRQGRWGGGGWERIGEKNPEVQLVHDLFDVSGRPQRGRSSGQPDM